MKDMDKKAIFEKKGKLGQDDDRTLDYAFWEAQGDEAKFNACALAKAYRKK